MTETLILCPTHDHADTLLFSVASLRAQHNQDWHLVVIGDGAPERTGEIMRALCAEDPRISYRSHPKGERYGEAYRDAVIRENNCEFVCHLSDDDLWAPDHLDNMVGYLADADWANQAPLRVQPNGDSQWWFVNNGTSHARQGVTEYKSLTAGPNFVSYRRSAYLKLSEGWTAAPVEFGPSDQYMWAKFMREPWLQIASTADTSALKLPSNIGRRRGRTPTERAAEIGTWLARIAHPDTFRHLQLESRNADRIFRMFAVHDCHLCPTLEAALERSGIALADPNDAFNTAVDGQIMSIPVNERLKNEFVASFDKLKALDDAKAWLLLHGNSHEQAIAGLRALQGFYPEQTRSIRDTLGD